ncbi:hypothetical protein NC652_017922 [Populus alba x Populus x berolinensis]|nr:hypothetical protein NC652_017916 [Populus alba x Populus x berolinensis]KAJ6924795.1 hypothetical protein NC652_017922 [Populus alba x Populus x berolinensis]
MAFYETGRWFPWRRIVTKTVQESPEKLFRGSICLYNGWQETTKFSEFSLMAFLLSPCRLFAHVGSPSLSFLTCRVSSDAERSRKEKTDCIQQITIHAFLLNGKGTSVDVGIFTFELGLRTQEFIYKIEKQYLQSRLWILLD